MSNTEAHQVHWNKADSRQGKSPFAQIDLAVPSELGLHNPIAAAIAQEQESEKARARTCADRVRRRHLEEGA